jgi:hypothetical protein
MTQTVSDALAVARKALGRDDWAAALDLFRQVAPDALAPGDLEAMADAAWWSARPDEAIELLQRAYAAYVEADKPARAGYVALTLAREYGVKFATAVSTSWFNRAKHLLEPEPESAELGYLYLRESVQETAHAWLCPPAAHRHPRDHSGQERGDIPGQGRPRGGTDCGNGRRRSDCREPDHRGGPRAPCWFLGSEGCDAQGHRASDGGRDHRLAGHRLLSPSAGSALDGS